MFNSIDINKAPSGNVHMDDLLPRIAFDTKAWKQMKMRDLFNHINANLVQSEWLTSNASGKDVSYLRPVDGIFSFDGVDKKGALKISLPHTYSSTMIMLDINVYIHDNNKSLKIFCGGYSIDKSLNKWYRSFAQITGCSATENLSIRFGHDEKKACIYIADLTQSWSYVKCVISSVLVGYTNAKISQWTQGWQFGFESEAFQNVTGTHTDCLIKPQTT